MFKSLLLCIVCAIVLTACEKEEKVPPTIGTVPKEIIDKATNDLNNATAIAADKLKAAETEEASEEDKEK